MKAVWLLLFLVACAAIAIAVWWSSTGATPTSPTHSSIPDSSVPEDARPATVNYVHDGDTLFLDTPSDSNLKVRLLAVDTPEVGDNAECFGDEARAHLRDLLPEGSTVYTLADTDETDQFGRALLFIWTDDGTFVNLDLVASGYAEAVFIGNNRLFENEFEDAEDSAYAESLGRWGAC